MSLRDPRELMKGKASDKLLHMDKIGSSPTPGSSRGEWMRESRSTMKGIEGREPSKLTMKVLEARRARANAALGRGPDDPRMSSLGRDSTAGSSRPSTAGSSTRSHRQTGVPRGERVTCLPIGERHVIVSMVAFLIQNRRTLNLRSPLATARRSKKMKCQ